MSQLLSYPYRNNRFSIPNRIEDGQVLGVSVSCLLCEESPNYDLRTYIRPDITRSRTNFPLNVSSQSFNSHKTDFDNGDYYWCSMNVKQIKFGKLIFKEISLNADPITKSEKELKVLNAYDPFRDYAERRQKQLGYYLPDQREDDINRAIKDPSTSKRDQYLIVRKSLEFLKNLYDLEEKYRRLRKGRELSKQDYSSPPLKYTPAEKYALPERRKLFKRHPSKTSSSISDEDEDKKGEDKKDEEKPKEKDTPDILVELDKLSKSKPKGAAKITEPKKPGNKDEPIVAASKPGEPGEARKVEVRSVETQTILSYETEGFSKTALPTVGDHGKPGPHGHTITAKEKQQTLATRKETLAAKEAQSGKPVTNEDEELARKRIIQRTTTVTRTDTKHGEKHPEDSQIPSEPPELDGGLVEGKRMIQKTTTITGRHTAEGKEHGAPRIPSVDKTPHVKDHHKPVEGKHHGATRTHSIDKTTHVKDYHKPVEGKPHGSTRTHSVDKTPHVKDHQKSTEDDGVVGKRIRTRTITTPTKGHTATTSTRRSLDEKSGAAGGAHHAHEHKRRASIAAGEVKQGKLVRTITQSTKIAGSRRVRPRKIEKGHTKHIESPVKAGEQTSGVTNVLKTAGNRITSQQNDELQRKRDAFKRSKTTGIKSGTITGKV